jgi:phosphatidylserine decarboxylase
VRAYTIMSNWPLSLNLMRIYPKKLASRIASWAAAASLPRAARPALLGGFARRYCIDLNEAELPLESYASLQAFFTRRLKAGLRPQDSLLPGAVNSPVDSRILACGRIGGDTALQAKGMTYRVSELLAHDAARFEGGHFLTLYLSPREYHRIHVPIEGRVEAVARVEGELWPVYEASAKHVPRLYARNRRAIWLAKGSGADEGLDVACVLVGATHVGGVIIDERWLGGRVLPKNGGFSIDHLPCRPGDDLGAFQFGSSVVLLVGGPRSEYWEPVRSEGMVQVGQRLGAFQQG